MHRVSRQLQITIKTNGLYISKTVLYMAARAHMLANSLHWTRKAYPEKLLQFASLTTGATLARVHVRHLRAHTHSQFMDVESRPKHLYRLSQNSFERRSFTRPRTTDTLFNMTLTDCCRWNYTWQEKSLREFPSPHSLTHLASLSACTSRNECCKRN